MKKLSVLLAASALTTTGMVVATPAAAQQTTSGIQGTVRAQDGSVLDDARVVITDTRTGASNSQATQQDGRFVTTGLPTGGPYTITATADGFQGQTVENVFINLSGNTGFTFELAPVSTEVAEEAIVITGTAANLTQLAVGPGQSIGEEVLQTLPTISRDVRDFIRIDPRVNIETDNDVDRISCLGGNDRSNVFTVDGIAQADVFGLNGTPFASRNSLPLPFDAIKETAVEFAPYDVQYGGFTGCAINGVTQSGTNTFHGSAFFEYRDDSFRGDSIDGEEFDTVFEEERYGATLGGPIIPDRLFFFLAYEELDSASPIETGPTGGGFPNELDFVTVEQFNEFGNILSSVYGRETGGIPRSAGESNQRYFGRIDAYITDDHRIEATYQRLEETNIEPDFGGDEYGGLNSFEDEGTVSNYYSARLFSNWTDRFSTELRYSRSEVGDQQGPVGGGEQQSDNPLPRFEVLVQNDGENGTLASGPGIFRSANQLDTTVDQIRVAANYEAGDHYLTVGYERNELDVFNLFAINATGTIFFDSFDAFRNGEVAPGFFSSPFGSADDLADGVLGGATIAATGSGDINEAAAEWKRIIDTFYIQDDFALSSQFDLLLGVRADIYSGDAPRFNPNFQRRFGFANNPSFDDIGALVMPRAAATYRFDNDEGFFSNTSARAGIGIFSGGDPAVWLSNAFSNDGFSTANGSTFDDECDSFDGNVLSGGSFEGFPQCAVDSASAQAAQGLAETQSTNPDIKIPRVLRGNFGLGTRFGTGDGFFDDWSLNVDYIYTRTIHPFNFVDLAQAPDIRVNGGFTTDGRPIYAAIDPLADGCNAFLLPNGGTPPVYRNLSEECYNTRRDDEIQLTNTDPYDSHTLSFILRKTFDGVFTEGGNVYFNLGYAYTDAQERRLLNSSTSTSSYDFVAAFDRQDPAVRASTYSVDHNLTAALSLREEFVSDLGTTLGIFFRASSGRPYSLTFDGGGVFNDSSSGSDNALLYVPTGVNDPNLSPDSDFAAVQQVIDYVEASGCDFTAGQTIRANTCNNDSFFDLDLRFTQELPGPGRFFGVDDRIELYATMSNFLNFLNDEWNVLRSRGVLVDVADGDVDDQGRYVIDGFNPDDDNDPLLTSSLWRFKVGIGYEF